MRNNSISIESREKAAIKFKEDVAKQQESMNSFNMIGNDKYSSLNIKQVRAEANKEFSALSRKNLRLQTEVFSRISSFIVR